MEAERKIYDVIVIGAGIAGLTAAESLLAHDKNLDVIVVEGSDRVGGRVCSQVGYFKRLRIFTALKPNETF